MWFTDWPEIRVLIVKPNLLILGGRGQLAQALKRQINPAEFKARYWGRNTLDLSAPAKTITAVLDKHPRPDLIINTAAYTHVDKAEDEPK
ncbi:MAG TPA: hypothetical protein ENJ42_03240, partial [Hellea balneolensis]|nr:hypothetical protein [Hellea balneolensis]